MPIAVVSVHPRRSGFVVPRLLAGGYVMALLDLAVAWGYWAPHGVSATRILQGIAAWLLGSAAFSGGGLTAALGLFIYGQLLWGVAMLYEAMARRHPLLRRRPLVHGAVYGAAAYVVIFQLLLPLLFGVQQVAAPLWTAACVLTYATVVGIPCALLARANHVAA
jgi:hypothetical protein